jgi:hypothetical protein
MSNDTGSSDDIRNSLSPTLITRYAHKSSRLIYSIEKNIFVVIGVVSTLAVVAVIDALEIIGITDFIGEGLDDTIVAILSLISLAALLPILKISLQSKKTLEDWADMFESNSIKNSISMSLVSTDKNDVLQAIAESVEELREPLLQYMRREEPREFIDREVGGRIYDILVDFTTVSGEKGTELRRLVEEYGAIIVKIVEGDVARKDVASFSDSVSAYRKYRQTRDGVGLAMIVGRGVSPDAYSKTFKGILIVEKP